MDFLKDGKFWGDIAGSAMPGIMGALTGKPPAPSNGGGGTPPMLMSNQNYLQSTTGTMGGGGFNPMIIFGAIVAVLVFLLMGKRR